MALRKGTKKKEEYGEGAHKQRFFFNTIVSKGDYAAKCNRGRKKLVLNQEDWVWLHLRKDRFST